MPETYKAQPKSHYYYRIKTIKRKEVKKINFVSFWSFMVESHCIFYHQYVHRQSGRLLSPSWSSRHSDYKLFVSFDFYFLPSFLWIENVKLSNDSKKMGTQLDLWKSDASFCAYGGLRCVWSCAMPICYDAHCIEMLDRVHKGRIEKNWLNNQKQVRNSEHVFVMGYDYWILTKEIVNDSRVLFTSIMRFSLV